MMSLTCHLMYATRYQKAQAVCKLSAMAQLVGCLQTTAKLRGVLPVVVDADVWEDAGEALDDIFIPDAEIWCVIACDRHEDVFCMLDNPLLDNSKLVMLLLLQTACMGCTAAIRRAMPSALTALLSNGSLRPSGY